MNEKCIYCGNKKAIEKDHIPPKSFFSRPRPSNLITVPSCSNCNREFGKKDEIVRNLLTSFDTTEIHPAVINQLAEKRNRSLSRNGGIHSLKFLLENMEQIDRYSDAGTYMGKFPAYNLDSSIVGQFLERITRGLLFHNNNIGYGDYSFEWKMAPTEKTYESMSDELKRFLGSGTYEYFGDGIFGYAGYTWPGKPRSLWIMNFYSGIEFMVIVRD